MPTQQRSSSTWIPNAEAPVRNRHSTGATARAVDGADVTCRRVTARAARCPCTAGAYPLRTFSPIFLAAAARAFSTVGKDELCTWPSAPMRPYRTETAVPSTVTS